MARAHAADLGLDAVKLGDLAQALGGNFRTVAVKDFLQLATLVRPTMRNLNRRAALAGGARQPVVAGIAIQLQGAVEAPQDLNSMGAGAAGLVGEDHTGRSIGAPSMIIPGKRPEIAGLGSATAWVEDRSGGLVHEQLAGRLEMLDQPRRSRRLGDPVRTGSASILRPDVDQDPKLRRNDVETLGPILADPVHPAAAAREIEARRFDDALDARQARGQMAKLALSFLSRGFGGWRGLLLAGLALGDGRFKVFEGLLPVVLAQFLRAFAMHDMVQLGHQMLEPPVCVLQGVTFLQHRPCKGGDRGLGG